MADSIARQRFAGDAPERFFGRRTSSMPRRRHLWRDGLQRGPTHGRVRQLAWRSAHNSATSLSPGPDSGRKTHRARIGHWTRGHGSPRQQKRCGLDAFNTSAYRTHLRFATITVLLCSRPPLVACFFPANRATKVESDRGLGARSNGNDDGRSGMPLRQLIKTSELFSATAIFAARARHRRCNDRHVRGDLRRFDSRSPRQPR